MVQSQTVIGAFRGEWSRAMALLEQAIGCFDEDQWRKGISFFEVPWKVSYHTIQCLAFYFRDDPSLQYRDIPRRFGQDWWELKDAEAPTQDDVLKYCREMNGRIEAYLEARTDADLSGAFPDFGTVAANLLYAMQHTLHHQGGLNVLAVYHGIDVDLWQNS